MGKPSARIPRPPWEPLLRGRGTAATTGTAAGPGGRCSRSPSRAAPCWGTAGHPGRHGASGPPGAEPVGQRLGKVPAWGASPTSSCRSQPGTVCATPYHCLNSKFSYRISPDFKTALQERKAAGGDAAGAGRDGSLAPAPRDTHPARAPGACGCRSRLRTGTPPQQTRGTPGVLSTPPPCPGPWDGEWIPAACSTPVLPLRPVTQWQGWLLGAGGTRCCKIPRAQTATTRSSVRTARARGPLRLAMGRRAAAGPPRMGPRGCRGARAD